MGDKFWFTQRLATSRWVVIVAAIWIQCCSGSAYNFAIYSGTIKTRMGYDQKNLDTLATAKDLGANIGVVSGLIFDWFTPRGVLAVGAVQSSFAYVMLWLSVTGRIAKPDLWLTCLYMFLAANGQTFFNTGCVVTCVQNFPRNRGVVIGLMKGFLGLSGAIMTQFYHGLYGNEPSSFLIMVAWVPSLITLSFLFTIRSVPALEERHESTNLSILSATAVALAAYLMGVIVLENTRSFSHAAYLAVCVVIIAILLLPMIVVVKSCFEDEESWNNSYSSSRDPLLINEIDRSFDHPQPVSEGSSIPEDVEGGGFGKSSSRKAEEPVSSGSANNEDSGSRVKIFPERTVIVDVQSAVGGPERGVDHTILEAIKKADFWMLVLAMACGMGSGLTANDNIGQIGASMGYAPDKVSTFISLFSIWNFTGRLGFGALSDLCLHRYMTGRPVFLAISQAAMSCGHLLISTALPGSLYPGSVIIGLCYGAQWSLMPAITSELFGLRRFATLFNTVSIASPIGAYFLSVQLAGRLYDYEAEKEHPTLVNNTRGLFRWLQSTELECHGAHCFRLTFIIMAAVSLFGCTMCMLLAARTRHFYSRMRCSNAS